MKKNISMPAFVWVREILLKERFSLQFKKKDGEKEKENRGEKKGWREEREERSERVGEREKKKHEGFGIAYGAVFF